MIITQNFFVKNEGLSITHDVGDLSNHTELGSTYSVCVFEYKGSLFDESAIEVRLQDYFFNGFVYKQTFKDNSMTTIECRSLTAKLTTPYDTGAEEIMPQNTAHDVIQELCDRVGVTVNISTIDFDIGTNFKKEGTALQSIMKLAEVTGAEVFDASGVLVMRPRKFIDITGSPVMETEVIGSVDIQETIADNAVGVLYLGKHSMASANSSAFVTAQIDENAGTYELLFYPPNYIESIDDTLMGDTYVPPTISTRMYKKSMPIDGDTEVFLDTTIYDLLSVKVNGIAINATVDVDTNKITFDSPKSGFLEVSYLGMCILGVLGTRDAYYELKVKTTEDEKKWFGKLNDNLSNGSVIAYNHELIYIRVPNEMNYVKGFKVFIGETTARITPTFSSRDLPINMETIRKTVRVETIAQTLKTTNDGVHIKVKTNSAINDVVGVKYKGVEQPYTVADAHTILLQKDVGEVVVTYKTTGTDLYVEGENKEGEDVRMNLFDILFPIEGYDPDDYRTYPCGLPQKVRLDVADMFGAAVGEVAGYPVTIKMHNGVLVRYNIDKYGFIEFMADANGDYVLDLSAIKQDAKATFTVSGDQNV